MSLICDKLASNIDNCSATPQRGFEELAYIFDISGMDLTRSNYLITDMAAKAGTTTKLLTVKVNGLQPYTGTVIEGAQRLAAMLFNKTASLIVVGNGPIQADIINRLTNGRYGIILRQRGVNDSGKFLVIGDEIGAKLDATSFESYSEANGWMVTLKEEMAIKSAAYLYKTDIAATESLITSLLLT